MATVLLIRHGRTAANAIGLLAGRSPGVLLDDVGRNQAHTLAARAGELPLVRIVASPLDRTRQTAEALAGTGGTKRVPRPAVTFDNRLLECDYGEWTNRPLRELAKEKHWAVVQRHPSAAHFPGGESLAGVAARAVQSVREHDEQVTQEFGPQALWAVVSHGDVVKAILADAFGLHLDQFQRIVVDPCSVSVVRFTPTLPFVERSNDTGASLAGLVPHRSRRRAHDTDAPVGGGSGPGAPS